MKSNIIFLDVDGVHLTGKYHMMEVNKKKRLEIIESIDKEDRSADYAARKEYSLSTVFDPTTIMLVNRLAEKSGAKIVIHSNWRRTVGHEATKNKLVEQGIKDEYFHEDYYCTYRMTSEKIHDINQWLDDHRVGESPRRPEPTFVNEEGYSKEAHEQWHIDIENYGFDYVIIDDDSIGGYGGHDFQVMPDFDEGFTFEEYRIACGILKVEDLDMDVHILSNDEFEKVNQYFYNKNKLYHWLYSKNDNKGYIAPRATLLSFKQAEKIANEPTNPWYGMAKKTAEEWYKSRSKSIWLELEVKHNKTRKHPSIIYDFQTQQDITGISAGDFENSPYSYPCLFIGTKENPEYLYAPDNVGDKEEFLFGYALAMEQKK
jgi:hypothetical protein